MGAEDPIGMLAVALWDGAGVDDGDPPPPAQPPVAIKTGTSNSEARILRVFMAHPLDAGKEQWM